MYHTGEEVPHPGYYLLERHEYDTPCQPSREDKKVLLDRGDEFPTCPECDDPAYWRYLRAENKK